MAPEPARATQPAGSKPWRLSEALEAPPWLHFGLEHRLRYEQLANDFRAAAAGSPKPAADARALVLRTLLSAELTPGPFVVGAELADSRAYATEGAPITNTSVDPLDVLQAYLGLRQRGALLGGHELKLTVGRFTLDVGSRRLVARNDFRNTINAFSGVDLAWSTPARHLLRGFAVMPVERQPSDAAGLMDNRLARDRERTSTLFWGLFFGSAPLVADLQVESYVFGLSESDAADAPSANRRLVTPGLRVLRPPAPGRVDLQAEGMAQVGTSRASTKPTDTADLSHRAGSIHLATGYRVDAPWSPRFALVYDLASGDGNPKDKVNGRFDPLFGARRFDFGPTGFYGALARSNLSSPGARVEVAPHARLEAMAGYRLVWLASAKDAWTTAGLRDPSGASGSFVGQQLEARVRWTVLPKNLVFEVGAAALARGGFLRQVPGGPGGVPRFFYTQLVGTL